jgi:hypothetical protein
MTTQKVPFLYDNQLCKELDIDENGIQVKNSLKNLPGQPLVSLNDINVLSFVETDLTTPLLNRLSPRLWLLATPDSTHVSALHAQIAKGRHITIREDPELHLVWHGARVFIKPLPDYLMSWAFWSYYLFPDKLMSPGDRLQRENILRAALGFIRTFFFLIRHESDFRIARQEHLIPKDVNFQTWMLFVQSFGHIGDDQVSGRYSYGELRLTRLNFWAKPLLGRWQFRKTGWQYAEHFTRYITFLLFLFATWTVILESMQVSMTGRPQWTSLATASAWFAVASMVSVTAAISVLLAAFAVLAAREIIFTIRGQTRRRRQRLGRMKALDCAPDKVDS